MFVGVQMLVGAFTFNIFGYIQELTFNGFRFREHHSRGCSEIRKEVILKPELLMKGLRSLDIAS